MCVKFWRRSIVIVLVLAGLACSRRSSQASIPRRPAPNASLLRVFASKAAFHPGMIAASS
jgi:hypothetical protein